MGWSPSHSRGFYHFGSKAHQAAKINYHTPVLSYDGGREAGEHGVQCSELQRGCSGPRTMTRASAFLPVSGFVSPRRSWDKCHHKEAWNLVETDSQKR